MKTKDESPRSRHKTDKGFGEKRRNWRRDSGGEDAGPPFRRERCVGQGAEQLLHRIGAGTALVG